MTTTAITPEEWEDLKAKSLGEKMFDAMTSAVGDPAVWFELGAEDKTLFEHAGIAMCASLTHDETASAVIASLTARAEKAEQQRDQQVTLIMDACDLLAERTYGNAARSPAHNARLMLEEGLQRIASPSNSEADNG